MPKKVAQFLCLTIALGIVIVAAADRVSPLYQEGDGFRGVILTHLDPQLFGSVSQEKIVEVWIPSAADIEMLESRLGTTLKAALTRPELLDRSVAESARRSYLVGEIEKIVDHLPDYRRQYLGIRLKDSKRIWVNFFPAETDRDDRFGDWLEEPIFVDDGGFWFWSIQYDPDSGEFFEFSSNGYA